MSAVSAMWGLIATHDTGDEIIWGVGWGALLGGVVAGLIGSAIVGGVGWLRRRRRDRADFGCLVGTYDVTRKHPSHKPEGTVTITGDGPLLAVVWTFPEPDGSEAVGTLAMNEQSRVTGSGSYQHMRGALGWGYLTLHVASREKHAARLLVDGRYTDDRTEVSTAWVWEMPRQAESAA